MDEARAAFESFLRDDDPTGQMPFPDLEPGQPYPDPQIDMQFRWFLRGWLAREKETQTKERSAG